MSININRTLNLDSDKYYQEQCDKNLIVLHHTVSGSANSTFNWWNNQKKHIATSYIIVRDGTIYEIFKPEYWAFHLGLKGTHGIHDRRSIGIEIVCWGGLREAEGKLYRFDKIESKYEFRGEYYKCSKKYRGYSYFEKYIDLQINSVIKLTDYLIDKFNIPRQTPLDHLSFNRALSDFEGVIGHHHVRPDKSDLHPGFDWNRFVDCCRLEVVQTPSVSQFAFDNLSKIFVRRVYLRMMERLLANKDMGAGALKRQRIALAITMAVPPATLTMDDIVDVGKRLGGMGLDISFRAPRQQHHKWHHKVKDHHEKRQPLPAAV